MSLVELKGLNLTTMTEEKLFCNALEGTTHSLRTTNLISNMEIYEFTYAKIEVHMAYIQCTVYRLKRRLITKRFCMYVPVAIHSLYYFL
jgi:hypothetical protein